MINHACPRLILSCAIPAADTCVFTPLSIAHLNDQKIVFVIFTMFAIPKPYRDAQDRRLWRQDLCCKYLAQHELESGIIYC